MLIGESIASWTATLAQLRIAMLSALGVELGVDPDLFVEDRKSQDDDG